MSLEVRLCHEGPERVLVNEFCRKVFASSENEAASATHPEFVAKNPYEVTTPPTAIAIYKDEIVGHVTSAPYRFWLNEREQEGYWLSGIFVLPEVRRMGVARKLAACITEAVPLVTGVAKVRASLRAFEDAHWVWPGRIADYVHIANPQSFLAAMSGDRLDRFLPHRFVSTADLLLRLLRGPLRGTLRLRNQFKGIKSKINRGADLPFEQVTSFGAEIDRLWETEKNKLGFTHVRSAAYMNWQFSAAMGWKKFVYRINDDTKAWGIYSIIKYRDGGPLDGLTALNVIDALWDSSNPELLTRLLEYVLHLGYSQKVDIVMFSGERPELKHDLKKMAFLQIPSTIYVGFHSCDKSVDFTQLFPASYITRGYADAAGNLGPQ